MAPTTRKSADLAGRKGHQLKGVRAPPHLKAGPYQSTPKRGKASGAVAPRNILGKDEVAASSVAKSSRHSLLSAKKDTPRKPSLARDSGSDSGSSFSKNPMAKTTKQKLSPKITSGSSKQENRNRSSGHSASKRRATPASSSRSLTNPATELDSVRRLRSYSHFFRRSLFASASKTRASSSRRSSTSDASPPLSGPKATPPSDVHTPLVKEKDTSLPKRSQASATQRRHSFGAMDASHARRSLANTPVLTSSDGCSLNTPFRAQDPKVALRKPTAEPAQEYSKEQLVQWDKQIRSWLNKQWKLCCLSAMSFFDIHKPNLRTSYQKALRNRMSDLLPFSVQVELETAHCFTRDPRITDAVVLTISYSVPREWDVRKSSRRKNKGDPSELERVLYKSLMIRAQLRHSQAQALGMSWYPIYLYNGREKIHQVVEQWLSDSFGACVSLKSLRATALLWAAGLGYQQSCGARLSKPVPVSLSYTLAGLSSDGWQQHRQFPSSHRVRDVSFLTLEMSADQMRNLALWYA
ncbi:hypothetical protein FHG87_004029 [Trinorchestia longiramus]|nr:hypothetical protein FHG87_004029 [Trinorchestia longiramus]